jgi:uncharacterized protein
MLGLVGLAQLGVLLAAPSASAGRFDCASRWLSRTEQTVCGDSQLMRLDEQLAHRLDGFASRLNFGQYLGLRHWHAAQARQRSQCLADRDCIAASFRAQGRFLDRLQRCVSASLARRACLREVLAAEQNSSRR